MTINPLMTRERLVISDRPALTKAQKVEAWNRESGICWWCGKPVAFDGPTVAYDHKLARELGGSDEASNLYPMHAEPCHKAKTLGEDVPRITKAHAQERKLTRPKGKRSRLSHPTLKRTMDGRVVSR